jgi:hypothetical protein
MIVMSKLTRSMPTQDSLLLALGALEEVDRVVQYSSEHIASLTATIRRAAANIENPCMRIQIEQSCDAINEHAQSASAASSQNAANFGVGTSQAQESNALVEHCALN